MTVSIVIAAYNAEKTIVECLEGCLRQTLPAHEIIVVDDGSTDSTKAAVSGILDPTDPAKRLQYLHQQNAGPAAARNHGARVATGDIVAFTDSDCVPEEGWLEALAAGFTDDAVAGVGGTYGIANPQSLLARMVHEEIVLRHERMSDEVDFLGSFNVAYRKSVFDTLGGFDESFRAASGEDNDLAYRIADTGGTLRFTRAAVVAHYHPERLWPYLRTQYRHGYWRVKLYKKHASRARGDRYAGLLDLVAPSLAPALIAAPVSSVISTADTWLAQWFELFNWVVVLLYLALQGWKGVPIARRAGRFAVLAFPVLLFCRDLARAIGMNHGMLDFVVLRKGTT